MLSQEQYYNEDDNQFLKQESFLNSLTSGSNSTLPCIFEEFTLQQDILPTNGTLERPFVYESSNESNSSPERTDSRSSENEVTLIQSFKTPPKFPMSVTVLHKPRGSKGVWEKVLTGDVLRVTREKGKRLKLQCQSEIEFDLSTVQVSIIDLVNAEVCSDPVVVEKHHVLESSSGFLVEFDVKLFIARRRLQISVYATSKNGDSTVGGFSVQFKTTSSGGAMRPMSSTSSPTNTILTASTTSTMNETTTTTTTQFSTKSDLQSSIKKRKISQVEASGTELTQLAQQPQPQPQSQSQSQHTQVADGTGSYALPIPEGGSLQYSDSLNASLSYLNVSTSSSIPTNCSYRPSTEYSIPQTGTFPSSTQPTLHAPVLPMTTSSIHSASLPQTSTESSYPVLSQPPVMLSNEIELNDFQNHVIPGSLSVTGVVRAKGFYQLSDIRLKCDIEELADAMQIVMALQGKKYRWKDGTRNEEIGGKKVIGFIAQQVRDIVPEAVHEEEDGYLSVNYEVMIPILVEAFKQHLQEYKEDKDDIKRQLSALKEQLDAQGAETNAEIQKIVKDITDIMKHKKPTPRSAQCSSTPTSQEQQSSTQDQPTAATKTTTDTTATLLSETTPSEASVSVPTSTNGKKTRTKARPKCTNNFLDRFFAGRLLYFILMLSALVLVIVGLMMLILNNSINAGNVSSQATVLHLFRTRNPGNSSPRYKSQKQSMSSGTILLDDARNPKETPPQAVGNSNAPTGRSENSSFSYESFVVVNVLGACFTFFGLVLGIVVVLLIIQAKKRQQQHQNGNNGT